MLKKGLLTIAILSISVQASFADSAKEMGINTLMFPVRALGVATGLVIGVPVAITRYSFARSAQFTNSCADAVGGKECVPSILLGSIPGITGGILAGTGEGLYHGGRNAIHNGSKQPFSMSSLTLENDLE